MSLGSENGLSVADIAAVTDRNNGNCGNGWGGGFVEMLIAMITLFLFPMFSGGFGGGMWGGMGGYSSRRDNRGRYSRDDGRSEMMEHLEMAMDTATDQDREIIKRFMRQLENA